MVKLLIGHKGSGKTKQMIDLDVYKRQDRMWMTCI